MEDNYPKAYKEVIEILNFVPQESVNKIPQTLIDMFKAKMDKSYDFEIDISKNFEEQNLLDETKAILANIFRDYWATPYQKERIVAKEKSDRKKAEKEKRELYNPNDIFKNRNNYGKEEEIREEQIDKEKINNLPAEIKKENFLTKLIKYIKINILKMKI